MRIGKLATYLFIVAIVVLLLFAMMGSRPVVGPYKGLTDVLADVAALGDRATSTVGMIISDALELRAPSQQAVEELNELERALANTRARIISTPNDVLLGSKESLVEVIDGYLGLVSVGRKIGNAARTVKHAEQLEGEGLYGKAARILEAAERKLTDAKGALDKLSQLRYLSRGQRYAIAGMERDVKRLLDLVRGYEAYLTLRDKYGDLLERHVEAAEAMRKLGDAAMRGDREGVLSAAERLRDLLDKLVSDKRYEEYMELLRTVLRYGYMNRAVAEATQTGDPRTLANAVERLARSLEGGMTLDDAMRGAFGAGAGGAGPRPQG